MDDLKQAQERINQNLPVNPSGIKAGDIIGFNSGSVKIGKVTVVDNINGVLHYQPISAGKLNYKDYCVNEPIRLCFLLRKERAEDLNQPWLPFMQELIEKELNEREVEIAITREEQTLKGVKVRTVKNKVEGKKEDKEMENILKTFSAEQLSEVLNMLNKESEGKND